MSKRKRDILKHEKHHGALAELYDFILTLVVFPSTAMTCIAICGFLGLSALAPVAMVATLGVLAGLGIFLAVSHYKKAKQKEKNHAELERLAESKTEALSKLSELMQRASSLEQQMRGKHTAYDERMVTAELESIFSKAQKVVTDQKAAELALQKAVSADKTSNPPAQVLAKIKQKLSPVQKRYKQFRKDHPKVVRGAKIAINVALGIISAIGVLGTIGAVMGGVGALAVLATPVGAVIFVVSAVAFIGMNLLLFHFVREKLSASHRKCKEELSSAQECFSDLENGLQVYSKYVAELEERLGSDNGVGDGPTFAQTGVRHTVVRQWSPPAQDSPHGSEDLFIDPAQYGSNDTPTRIAASVRSY